MPGRPPASTAPGPWAHARAVLLLLHATAVIAIAVPAPEGGMQRGAWTQPTVQAEFRGWAARLQAAGVETTPEQLEDDAWDFAVRYTELRETALSPVRPYARYLHTAQSWRMFVAPHLHPSRLQVALRDAPKTPWTVVYLQSTPGEHWMEDVLEHDRTRSLLFRYAWGSFRTSFKHFAAWLAQRALEDFPDAQQVRVRWLRQRTPTPKHMRDGVEHHRIPHGGRLFHRDPATGAASPGLTPKEQAP